MAKQVRVYTDEIVSWAERFEVKIDEDNMNETLISVLEVGAELDDDEYEELPEELRNRIEVVAQRVEENNYKLIERDAGGAAATGTRQGRGRRNPDGPVAKIRGYFNKGEGIVTVPEMIKALAKEGVETSPATVRTQVGRLRKEHGITAPGGGGGRGFQGRGVVAKIKEFFNEGKGLVTVKDITNEMHAWGKKNGVEFSSATIRTQVTRLRKQYKDVLPKPEAPTKRPTRGRKKTEEDTTSSADEKPVKRGRRGRPRKVKEEAAAADE